MQGVPGRFVEETPKDSFQLGFLAVKDWQPDLPALERENQRKSRQNPWSSMVPATCAWDNLCWLSRAVRAPGRYRRNLGGRKSEVI